MSVTVPDFLPAIAKASWQPAIFAAVPRRSALLALQPSWPCRQLRLSVYRNMPFEFVASALPPFLAYADYALDLKLSDYDDSLQFQSATPADCALVWLDYSRYAGKLDKAALTAWLTERLQVLRAASAAPILLADSSGADAALNHGLAEIAARIPGCRIFPRQELQDRLGEAWFDKRVKDIAASTMSDAANLAVAQALGLLWLPGAVRVALKAIVLDLDHTLYAGVLGEDGVAGVRLTPAHRVLQEKLRTLKEQGLFLALLSRNEDADVVRLFRERSDFPLRLEDCTVRSVSWGEKSAGMADIAAQLRIGTDAMLMLDDNLGEIGRLAQAYPAMSLLYAADPIETARALDLFPGLLRWHQDATDRLRSDDLKAAAAREAEQAVAADPLAYMQSLDIQLHCLLDPAAVLSRLTDLAHKTNQFTLTLARFSEAEVARRLADPCCATIAVALTDKLSDSGVIAALFCHADGAQLIVDEICISCRALGRGVEDVLIATALRRAAAKLGTSAVALAYDRGPRNDPARDWLARWTGLALPGAKGLLNLPWQDVPIPDLPVCIAWDDAFPSADQEPAV